MKFSFRYFIAFIIFIGLGALVGKQVLLENEKKYTENFLDAINPFWNMSLVQKEEKFLHTFNLEVNNNSETWAIITGKLFLNDDLWNPLKNIWIIKDDNNDVWNLTDYLLINPLKEIIPAKNSKIFHIEWQWLWDKYFNNKNVVIHFESPFKEISQTNTHNISFYQKLLITKKTIPLHLKKVIELPNWEIQTTEEDIQITYNNLEKTFNTGLLFIFGVTTIFYLIFSKISSNSYKNQQYTQQAEIEIFEKETKKFINNLLVKKKVKKISQWPKNKNPH